MVVLLGLAIFDFGPRADASFRTTLGSDSAGTGAADNCGSSEQIPTTWPPVRTHHTYWDRAVIGLGETGGAGAPTTAAGAGTGSSMAAALNRVDFSLNLGCEKLRVAEIKSIVSKFVTSVFEPPRVVV